MLQRLEQIRDRLLVKSPTARFCAEHGMLGMARVNRALGLRNGIGNVVMFHAGRSGSQVLAGQLAQHPEIFWDNELFWGSRLRAYRALGEKRFKPLEIARLAPFKTLKNWYGYEIKAGDFERIGLEQEHFVNAVRAQGNSRFILLERRNILRWYISWQVLKQTRQPHFRVDEKVLQHKVTVDVQDLMRLSFRLKAFALRLREQLPGEQLLQLSYEEHIEQDPGVAYQRVCRFLGLAEAPASVKLRRGNPFPLQELVSNYSQLRAELKATELAWMLEG